MNGLSISIDDIKSGNNLWLTFDKSDIEKFRKLWNEDSEILSSYDQVEIFEGFKKYSQLNNEHYRFLIMAILRKEYSTRMLDVLQEFIIMFSFCLEQSTKGVIDHMSITRVTDELLYFNIPLKMDMNFPKPRSHSVNGLRLVIDR